MTKRYLSLFNEDGSPVEHANLYLLARMGTGNLTDGASLDQVFAFMTGISDNTQPALTTAEKVLERKFISNNQTERRYAAMVVAELLGLTSEGKEATLGAAIDLVAEHVQRDKPNTQRRSLVDSIKRAFSEKTGFRNTSHLELAFRLTSLEYGFPENLSSELGAFLSQAKALEIYIDELSEQGSFKWNPWRIPDTVKPVPIETLFPVVDGDGR